MENCKGCGTALTHAPIGLCPRCRRRLRDAARDLQALLWCLAGDAVLELLGALANRHSALYDGTAAEFVEVSGWPLAGEAVH